jgi:L-asparaginase
VSLVQRPAQNRRRPVVGVFSLGGTIAMTPVAEAGSGVTPRLGAADLVAAVPGLTQSGIEVQVHDVRQLPGASLGFADIVALADAIQEQLDVGAIVGAVVTQGTDTIEETSWLLDLLHTAEASVVVTGAMRHPRMAGADGPGNLLAAIQVAADSAAVGLGVLVVLGEDVHAARAVRKIHSTSLAAFESANIGPIGHLSEGTVRIWQRPPRLIISEATRARSFVAIEGPRVVVVPMALGQDDAVLRAIGEHADGLVVAGFGVGHVPGRVVDALTGLAARIPVILAARPGAGPVAAGTYAFPGSESDLLARGLVRAGYLDAYKARVLLHVLLAGEATMAETRRVFAAYGCYEGS